MVNLEIYFRDLTSEAQKKLLKAFQTTEADENWEIVPLAIIEREEESHLEKEENNAVR